VYGSLIFKVLYRLADVGLILPVRCRRVCEQRQAGATHLLGLHIVVVDVASCEQFAYNNMFAGMDGE